MKGTAILKGLRHDSLRCSRPTHSYIEGLERLRRRLRHEYVAVLVQFCA